MHSAKSCVLAFPILGQNIENLAFVPYNSTAKQEQPLSYTLLHNFVQESLLKREGNYKSFAVNYNHEEA